MHGLGDAAATDKANAKFAGFHGKSGASDADAPARDNTKAWPDVPEHSARPGLRNSLGIARQSFIPEAMESSAPLPGMPDYRDRHTGLIIFGVFSILIGTLCAVVAPLALFGQVVAARRLAAEFDLASAFLGTVVYALMAIVLVWLGVGSVLARRWARTLLLCLGWIGLVIGVVAMPAVFFMMNSIGDTLRVHGQEVHPLTVVVIKFFALMITFVIYIMIPGVAVLFYRSSHVRRTCEVRDPVERWTDRCPVPVLVLCLIQGFGALMLLLILPLYGRVFPFAGVVVQGWTARLLWLGLAAFLALAARGFYRLNPRMWWAYLVVTLLLWTSSLATIGQVGLIDFYRQMGLPERQLEIMANNPLIRHGIIVWLSALGMGGFLAYLFYLRRYFGLAKGRPAAA
jgi:hypothetical protein